MKLVIRLTRREEAKALPILLRHSPGMVLPNRTYVLREDAVAALRAACVRFVVATLLKGNQVCCWIDQQHT